MMWHDALRPRHLRGGLIHQAIDTARERGLITRTDAFELEQNVSAEVR